MYDSCGGGSPHSQPRATKAALPVVLDPGSNSRRQVAEGRGAAGANTRASQGHATALCFSRPPP
jgi:hypothetical protein